MPKSTVKRYIIQKASTRAMYRWVDWFTLKTNQNTCYAVLLARSIRRNPKQLLFSLLKCSRTAYPSVSSLKIAQNRQHFAEKKRKKQRGENIPSLSYRKRHLLTKNHSPLRLKYPSWSSHKSLTRTLTNDSFPAGNSVRIQYLFKVQLISRGKREERDSDLNLHHLIKSPTYDRLSKSNGASRAKNKRLLNGTNSQPHVAPPPSPHFREPPSTR